jgi:uncharacterized membrane protein YvbJ
MEGDVTKLSSKELEEQIKELEHTYVEFFGEEVNAGELHNIHKRILELQKELHKRRDR